MRDGEPGPLGLMHRQPLRRALCAELAELLTPIQEDVLSRASSSHRPCGDHSVALILNFLGLLRDTK